MVRRAVDGRTHVVSFWQIWPYERRGCLFFPALAAIEHTVWGERSASHGQIEVWSSCRKERGVDRQTGCI